MVVFHTHWAARNNQSKCLDYQGQQFKLTVVAIAAKVSVRDLLTLVVLGLSQPDDHSRQYPCVGLTLRVLTYHPLVPRVIGFEIVEEELWRVVLVRDVSNKVSDKGKLTTCRRGSHPD